MSILKNVAGQSLYAVLVSSADGSAVTSGATVAVNGTAGTGTLTHLGGGLWRYALAQAETNYNSFGYVFAGAGVIPVGGMVVTQDYPRDAIPAVGAGSSGGLPLAGSDGVAANVVSVAGTAVTGPAPTPTVTDGKVAATIDLTQTLSSPRDLSAVADTGLTLNDALHAAAAGAAGQESVSGTAYTVKTSAGTVLRTFTLDSATNPTSRS